MHTSRLVAYVAMDAYEHMIGDLFLNTPPMCVKPTV